MRTARIERVTSESSVVVEINLDGSGRAEISTTVPFYDHNPLIRIVPFERPSIPKRRVVLAWRKTFPRVPAVQAVQHGVELIRNLHGCRMLTSLPAVPA